ncbi:hypothetical protein BG95_04975 [Thermosipho sp. 1063]|uniref:glycosyltransferase family 4 protein n=1 Tax=unclassified Thermosipho (in: thermotogales) TaxID=2676525 RepID=UPI00094931E5|nr:MULTISPECIES: glycosyltransferase family 4 protein [unclassified Thermosipho (in: thermotogales)]ANQ54637.1 hypothetical protein Y592_05045 [Thermosipho sp. 1070]APT73049.1 hypothetical protein BG95_04975 [Thermosipho sp. 1063]
MNLERFILNGEFKKVVEFLEKGAKSAKDFNILGVAYYNLGKRNKAISNFKRALYLDQNNIDALFNLSEIYIQLGKYVKAKDYVLMLLKMYPTWDVYDMLSNIYTFEGFFESAYESLKKAIAIAPQEKAHLLREKLDLLTERMEKVKLQKKLAIVCAKGFDNFIDDIVHELSDQYWVQRRVVKTEKEIKDAINWADIVWLEWANEVAVIATNYPEIKGKRVVLRLHGYESLRKDFLLKINWNNVNDLIFVAKNVMKTAVENQPIIQTIPIHFVPNGINLEKYKYKVREKGYNIGFLGFFNYKKNPILAVQILKKLVDKDKKYKLYWAGQIQDDRMWRYINYILKKMGIIENFVFDGWVDDTDEWLEDKDVFLSTSIHEGYGIAIMEAMAKGIKPVIHNFYIAEEFYPKKYLFNTVDEAVDMITNGDYTSDEYRKFIKKYSLKNQIQKIKSIIQGI